MTQRVKKSIDKNFKEASESKQKDLIAQLVLSEFDTFYETYIEIVFSDLSVMTPENYNSQMPLLLIL